MIEHNGQNCPCNPEENVIVKIRGGGIMVGTARNYVWNWKSSPYNGDVVEYQIIP
jgi:hypothetical protein